MARGASPSPARPAPSPSPPTAAPAPASRPTSPPATGLWNSIKRLPRLCSPAAADDRVSLVAVDPDRRLQAVTADQPVVAPAAAPEHDLPRRASPVQDGNYTSDHFATMAMASPRRGPRPTARSLSGPDQIDMVEIDHLVNEHVRTLVAKSATSMSPSPSMVKAARRCLTTAEHEDQKQEYMMAYVMYLRFCTMVTETLRDFPLPPGDIRDDFRALQARVPNVLKRCETLKHTIKEIKREELIRARLASPGRIASPARAASPASMALYRSASPAMSHLRTPLPPRTDSARSSSVAPVSPSSDLPLSISTPPSTVRTVAESRPRSGAPHADAVFYYKSVQEKPASIARSSRIHSPAPTDHGSSRPPAPRSSRDSRSSSLDPRGWGSQQLDSDCASLRLTAANSHLPPPTASATLHYDQQAVLGSVSPRGSAVLGSPRGAASPRSLRPRSASASSVASIATVGDPVAKALTRLRLHDGGDPVARLMGGASPNVPGVVGLKNLGNSCYMNSVLQCLYATEPLKRYFTSRKFFDDINEDNPLGTGGTLSTAVFHLLLKMEKALGTLVAPSGFRDTLASNAPQFADFDQQDAQELLAYVLDALHEDLKRPSPHDPSPPLSDPDPATLSAAQASDLAWTRYLASNHSRIASTFQGLVRSQVKCLTCGAASVTYAPFTTLSVPLPRHARPATGSEIALDECLAAFVHPEILEGENMWRCPQCDVPVRAEKRTTIARWPQVLVVHLKRFTAGSGPRARRAKLNHLVRFPVHGLEVGRVEAEGGEGGDEEMAASNPGVYDLYAVANHYGGLDRGHYTAMVNHGDKGWFMFDDARVAHHTEDQIVTPAAYLLFYLRRPDAGADHTDSSIRSDVGEPLE
ncbi:ubiquitin-specific protease doa4 [Allomyces arbusculus]|nr:ubiquitin-specific protease doa4 [Allomyces arbusculus]